MTGLAQSFRIYDKKQDRMITEPQNFFVSGDGSLYNDRQGLQKVNYLRFELMWFIGNTDKNKKQIYEGDIVKRKSKVVDGEVVLPKYDGALGVVVFEDGGFKVDKKSGHKWAFYGPDGINFSWNGNLKVVGNVFENSVVLEEENET